VNSIPYTSELADEIDALEKMSHENMVVLDIVAASMDKSALDPGTPPVGIFITFVTTSPVIMMINDERLT